MFGYLHRSICISLLRDGYQFILASKSSRKIDTALSRRAIVEGNLRYRNQSQRRLFALIAFAVFLLSLIVTAGSSVACADESQATQVQGPHVTDLRISSDTRATNGSPASARENICDSVTTFADINNARRAAIEVGVAELDDLPEPFDPRCPADEDHRDRLHAQALFASGCVYRHKDNPERALRQFQRAHQYDPKSKTIVEAVVELTDELGRMGSHDRYLQRLFELGGGDTVEVEEMAFRIAMSGRLQEAIAIYERLLAIREEAQPQPIDVVTRWRLSEVYYLADRYKQAANCATWVLDALDHPQRYGLNADMVARLLEGPHPPFALFGEFFLLADQPQRAEEMFIKADAVESDKLLLEYRLARVDAQMGKNREALGRLEFCLAQADKLREHGLEPYELLEKTLTALGKKDELIERLKTLYKSLPKNVILGYALCECYRREKQVDKAESLYKALLARQPATVGYAGLLEIYRSAGRLDDLLALLAGVVVQQGSIEPFGKAIDAVIADQSLLEQLARISRPTTDAAESKGSVEPKTGTFLAVALLALEAKRFDLAHEFFDYVLQSQPSEAGELVLIWSLALLADERNSEAADVLQRGFTQKLFETDDSLPYYYLANALAMCDKIDEALAAARKAAALKSDSPHFVAQPAWVLYRGKRYDEAAAVYEQLLSKFDVKNKDESVRETMRGVRLALAGIEAIRGNTLQAESLLEEVLDEFPDDIAALNDLGFLWADENRHLHRALRMTRKAVAAEPDNTAYRDSLGWALFRLGRLDEAVAELEKAAAASDDEEIHKHLEEVTARIKKSN